MRGYFACIMHLLGEGGGEGEWVRAKEASKDGQEGRRIFVCA